MITFGKPTYNIKLGIWTGIVLGSGGDEPGPEPVVTETYAIFDNLAAATALLPDTYFDWVWAKDVNIWYRYNNLGKYEEYGIYADSIDPIGSGRTKHIITTSSAFDTGIYPSASTIVKAKGTLKQFNGSYYIGTMGTSDNNDYRWFITGSTLYFDCKDNRINQSPSGMAIGNSYDIEFGNDYIKGNFNGNEFSYTGATCGTISIGKTILINFDSIDITELTITDDSGTNYSIVKEDGIYYSLSWGITGSTTYKGKLALVEDNEYEYNGSAWNNIGDGILITPIATNVSNFTANGTESGTTLYRVSATTGTMTYQILKDTDSFTLYIGLQKTDAGNYGISASTLNGTDTYFGKYITTAQALTYYPVTYTDVHYGDVITITYSGSYRWGWGYGYTFAPDKKVFAKFYSSVDDGILARAYNTYDDFTSDTNKYGNSLIYIIDDDAYYGLSYDGEVSSITRYNCYQVCKDITTLTEPMYYQTYDKATSSWYMVNNKGKFEKYGIYATSIDDTETTYKGKLAIVDTAEYEFNGNEWEYLGELPDVYDWMQISADFDRTKSFTKIRFIPNTSKNDATIQGFFSEYPNINLDGYAWASATTEDTGYGTYHRFNPWYNYGGVYTNDFTHVNKGDTKITTLTQVESGVYELDLAEGQVLYWGGYSGSSFPFTSTSVYATTKGYIKEYETKDAPESVIEFESEEAQTGYTGCTYAGEIGVRTDTGAILYRQEAADWNVFDSPNQIISYETNDENPVVLSAKTGYPGNVVTTFYTDKTKGKVLVDADITTIPASAFTNNTNLTSYTLPSSVTLISHYAFAGCSNCKISIPSTLTELQLGTWKNAGDNSSVVIPDSVTRIKDYCFQGAKLAGGITIPNSVTKIENYCFRESTLPSITLPDNLTLLGIYAFASCNSLTGITFGNSIGTTIKKIPDYCFLSCHSLAGTLVIPEGVTEIGMGTFQDTRITSVSLPSTLTILDGTTNYGSFSNCGTLTGELVIPDAVTSIGAYCFINGTGITSMVLGPNVQFIGWAALWEMPALTSLTFSDCAQGTSYSYGNGVCQFWAVNLQVLRMPNLKIDFWVRSTAMTEDNAVVLLNDLYDFVGAGESTTRTIYFTSAVFSKLTDDDIAIATAKGWSVATK